MTRCVCHADPAAVPAEPPAGELHVLLHGGRPVQDGTAAIGARLRELYRQFSVQPSEAAVDLVSIALAVTAADTFVPRKKADNGWTRRLDVELPLCSPDIWEESRADLERLLSFLSGDRWSFGFRRGGEAPPPMREVRRHERAVDLSGGDLVSLFSGGLDSTVSTLSLLDEGRRPILVSHAYAGDAGIQRTVAAALPKRVEHVAVNARPASALATDISMRSRSFLFIAIAALVCDARSAMGGGRRVELRVPENGFMSINAPLTPRRIGSLSTRTTHPYFLGLLQDVLDSAGLPAGIRNPWRFRTKGEMIGEVGEYPGFAGLAARTVSCARWKRSRVQCGHCVPCLVRRAALHAANVDDLARYRREDLDGVMAHRDRRDDLMAVARAVGRLETEDVERWVARSGPLPADGAERRGVVAVFARGLQELGGYLRDCGPVVGPAPGARPAGPGRVATAPGLRPPDGLYRANPPVIERHFREAASAMPEPSAALPPAPVPPEAAWFAGIGDARNRRGYLRDVREFMDFAGFAEPGALREAAPEQVAAWRDALLARPLRAATVRRKLTALSSLYGEFVAAGAARRNPVEGIERPDVRTDARPAPVLTGRQARRLLDAPPADTLKGLRDRAVLAVLLYHGLTRQELCRLSTGDFIRSGGEPVLRVAGRRARVLAAHPEAAERIGAWLEGAGHGGDAAGPLFRPMAGKSGGAAGRALDPGSVYREVVRVHAEGSGLAAEVEGIGAHALRATAAATALGRGTPPGAVRDWLGHASLATTAQYCGAAAEDEESASVRVSYPKARRRSR